MLNLIDAQGFFPFPDGNMVVPPMFLDDNLNELNPNFVAQKKSNHTLKRWIIGTLSEEALISVVGFNTYTDVWNVVKKDYAKCFDDRGLSFQ